MFRVNMLVLNEGLHCWISGTVSLQDLSPITSFCLYHVYQVIIANASFALCKY